MNLVYYFNLAQNNKSKKHYTELSILGREISIINFLNKTFNFPLGMGFLFGKFFFNWLHWHLISG